MRRMALPPPHMRRMPAPKRDERALQRELMINTLVFCALMISPFVIVGVALWVMQ